MSQHVMLHIGYSFLPHAISPYCDQVKVGVEEMLVCPQMQLEGSWIEVRKEETKIATS